MFVDETGNFTNTQNPFYIGACGVVVPRHSRKAFESSCRAFRQRLPEGGLSITDEIHAVEWLRWEDAFTINPYAEQRVELLREFMRQSADCKGLRVINVMAQSELRRVPEDGQVRPISPARLHAEMRRDVFKMLFREFERTLEGLGRRGHSQVDDDRIGGVADVARGMSAEIRQQPVLPIGVDSKLHHGVQLADVCAYFMLQQFEANYTVRLFSAELALDEVAPLCPDPHNPGRALIYRV